MQFAALAAATLEAVGPGAIWRDQPGAVVREVDRGDGRMMLRIDTEARWASSGHDDDEQVGR